MLELQELETLDLSSMTLEELQALKNKVTKLADQECYNVGVDYNVHDVALVARLENKRSLLRLAVSMAYTAKINYQDVFSPVRSWDTIIYNYLRYKNVIVPNMKYTDGDGSIEGAHVKEPTPGMYDWVVSYDLNSLYPHIIMALNMSPETLDTKMADITVDDLLSGNYNSVRDGYSLAGNGARFDMTKTGFLSDLMRSFYNMRKKEKKLMLQYEAQLEQERSTASKERIEELEALISTKDSLQNATKTLLNSAYGATANRGFRFFDHRIAEGITKTGQLVIQTAEVNANRMLDKLIGTESDRVIAMDTDSVTGDSLVYVNGSKCRIDELFLKFQETCYSDDFNRSYVKPVNDIKTLSFNIETKTIESKEIRYVMKHRVKKKMYKIHLNDKSVIVTEDHSVIVKRNGRYISVKPGDLDVNKDKIINILNTTIGIE